MRPANLLVIMSDEHNPKIAGHAGHPIVHTPHLDADLERWTALAKSLNVEPQ